MNYIVNCVILKFIKSNLFDLKFFLFFGLLKMMFLELLVFCILLMQYAGFEQDFCHSFHQ